MKKVIKLSTGLVLGAVLCLGVLAAPPAADAAYWSCPGRVNWCADVIFSGGARYCNTGMWCHVSDPSQDRCYYNRC